MHKFPFNAIFYDKPDGTEPAKEFLYSLDVKMRAKMDRTITLIRHGGTTVREPYSKHLDDGIFEVRAKIGSDISRILFFFYIDKSFILTHGFIKKTQKTPDFEIKRAKKYRQEYLSRKSYN